MLSTYYERGRRSGHPPTERIIVHSSDKALCRDATNATNPSPLSDERDATV